MIFIERIREEFPFFQNNKGVCFLDSAASTQKLQYALNEIDNFYYTKYSNVHRGIYTLSNESTYLYEKARSDIASYLGLSGSKGIIFTKSATESLNMVAQMHVSFLSEKDVILLSIQEHHSNIVPWMMCAKRTGAQIKWIPLRSDYSLDYEYFEKCLKKYSVKIVAITHMSNVTGHEYDIKKWINKAHAHGARIVVDGTQYVAHNDLSLCDLDVDFYVFSGHKMYTTTGIGVLYIKDQFLDIDPCFGGGQMISSVTQESFSAADPPYKFEAGTPPFVEAWGLRCAMHWLRETRLRYPIRDHERSIKKDLLRCLQNYSQHYYFIGNPDKSSCLFSFVIPEFHSHDASLILSNSNVCVRAGHHCCQPLMDFLKVSSCIRVSIGVYTDESDVSIFRKSLVNLFNIVAKYRNG